MTQDKNQCSGCPVHQGTHKPVEAVHVQIAEPQPEALRLADALTVPECTLEYGDCMKAGELLRAQHARIAELESQLEAIGAGGVEPLRKQAAAPQAAQAAVPVVRGEVLVTVSGFTGSGKSAIAGEIEIMCRALGLQVEWPDGVTEKNMTHADWTTALELYNPRVRIIERNVPRNTASGADQ